MGNPRGKSRGKTNKSSGEPKKSQLQQDLEKTMVQEYVTNDIYALRGVTGASQARFKKLDTVTIHQDDIVPDTFIERYLVRDDVVGETYACVLTDQHIMQNKKLPLAYTKVSYVGKFSKTLLYLIGLNFEITKQITKREELLNEHLEGVFTLDITLDGNTESLDDKLGAFPGEVAIMHKLKKITKANDMIALLPDMIKEAENKRTKDLRKQYNEIEVLKPSFTPDLLENMSRKEMIKYLESQMSS